MEKLQKEAFMIRTDLSKFINDWKGKSSLSDEAEDAEKRKIEDNLEEINNFLTTSLDKLLDANAADETNLKQIHGDLNDFYVDIDKEYVRIRDLDPPETRTDPPETGAGCENLDDLLKVTKNRIEMVRTDPIKMRQELLDITSSIDQEINSFYDPQRRCHQGKKKDLDAWRNKNNDVYNEVRNLEPFDPMSNSDLEQYMIY